MDHSQKSMSKLDQYPKVRKIKDSSSIHSKITTKVGEVLSVLKQEDGKISVKRLVKVLSNEGFQIYKDIRFKKFTNEIDVLQKEGANLDLDNLNRLLAMNMDLITRAITHQLSIPDFEAFLQVISILYAGAKYNCEGKAISLAPQMMVNEEETWALSLLSVDGQRYELGQTDIPIVMEGMSNIFLYALAMEMLGSDYVHEFVGVQFVKIQPKEIFLNNEGRPYNALTTAGALVITAMLLYVAMKEDDIAQKFDNYLIFLKNLSSKNKMNFNNTILLYLKERSQYLRSQAYFLKAHNCVPQCCNVESLLDFFIQVKAIEITCNDLAMMGATIANDGVNPMIEKRITSTRTNQCLLSAMKSFGFNNESEEFSFNVGLPVFTTSTGLVLLIVPGITAFVLYSPLVNEEAISERAKDFCYGFSRETNSHPYDLNVLSKIYYNPTCLIETCPIGCPLFSAVWRGDFSLLLRLIYYGYEISQRDYMQRTILHVAASRGHLDLVKYVAVNCPTIINWKDSTSRTARDDAVLFQQDSIRQFLDNYEKVSGASKAKSKKSLLRKTM